MLNRIPFGVVDLASPAARNHPLNRRLAGWWMAAPGGYSAGYGGGRFADLSGRGSHGTITSATWAGAKGRPGGWGALSFNGSSAYVDCGNGTYLNPANAITVSAWIYCTAVTTSFATIVNKDTSGGAQIQYTLRFSSTTGKVMFRAGDAGAASLVGATILSNNTWYHVAGTYDVNNGNAQAIYLNGVADNSGTSTGSMTPRASTLAIGRRNTDGLYFPGLIDDVRVYYERALSAAEVRQLYLLSRQGYLGVLSRAARRYLDLAAAVATSVPMRTLLGVGG
jgi:hypothetical protein